MVQVISKARDRSLVTFKLLNSANKKELDGAVGKLKRIRKRTKVTSIEIQAVETFQRFVETFNLNDLVRPISGVTTMENFSLDLNRLPIPTPLASQSVRGLIQCPALKSLVLINVRFSGLTTRLKTLTAPNLEYCRLVNCQPENPENPEGCLSNFLLGLTSVPSLHTIICSKDSFVSELLAAQAICQMVSTDHITTLTINKCKNILPTTLFRPLELLKINTTLRELTLETVSPMTDQVLQWIGEMLVENAELEELLVDIGSASLLPIATALETNRTLIKFSVLGKDNQYTPEADILAAFERVLESNCVLEHLGVPNASRDHKWNTNIDHYLRLNRAGRQYLWNTEQSVQADWVNAIIRNHFDHAIMFELIRKNPSAICHLRGDDDDSSSDEEESSDEESMDERPRQRRRIC